MNPFEPFSEATCTVAESDVLNGVLQVYLWPPAEGPARETIMALVAADGYPFAWQAAEGCVRVTITPIELTGFMLALADRLSTEEAGEVKTLLIHGVETPQLRDMARVVQLAQLISQQRALWLQRLLEEGRFTSHFQPIVYAQDTTRIYGYEALLRAFDQHGQPVPPLRLFSCARNANLVIKLDRNARQTAIQALYDHGVPGAIFINCTAASLQENELTHEATLQMLDGLMVPRQRIVLEVVESEGISDLAGFSRVIERCRAQGFRIAIDDVGSGYSSLNWIHYLRPDFVKLDMGLVRNVHTDAYKAAITQNLLDMSRKLGIQTIAEGVEQPEELAWLRERGADFLQGYLIARPAAPATLVLPTDHAEDPRCAAS